MGECLPTLREGKCRVGRIKGWMLSKMAREIRRGGIQRRVRLGRQDKKLRALLKKLRAIDDLKMRRAGGEKLEGTQIKKMGTEDEIRRELEGLGWSE